MASPEQTFRDILKSAGSSVTAARLRVFEALRGQEPLHMHDLVVASRPIDRASVYRAVELFEQLGIVQRLYTGWKYRIELTDKFAAHHHHITCTRCNTTVSIGEAELESALEKLARSHGFTTTAHQIEIQGLCSQCVSDMRD